MANYVCSELETVRNIYGGYDCKHWLEYQTSVDMLAITEQQADMILVSSLVVVFTAWIFRQVLNLILRRRY